ncbi:hypothetical protein ACFPL7_05220 [Dongia soli]|uniref:DUF4239 domain-containing protein n=1 Tax=Dongia soli TaxID=600628 RepID=A0ABU5EG24_9PROT|nr:hypothetical protein [Dongia soli]MDY0884799.1 hypothetical protein [Dongia soli]
MSEIGVAVLVFLFVVGGAFLGLAVRRRLPEHHVDSSTQDVVRLVMGLVATMSALVLGLLIVSAKNNFDTQSAYVAQLAAEVIEIDRILAHYGPETADARGLFRDSVVLAVERIWPADGSTPENTEPPQLHSKWEAFYDRLQKLEPQTNGQHIAQSNAMQLGIELLRTRTLMYEKLHNTLASPFLVVLVFWLILLFVGFGLQTPPNVTILVTFLLGALSTAGAVLLILELDQPYSGLLRVSSGPLQRALSLIGQAS